MKQYRIKPHRLLHFIFNFKTQHIADRNHYIRNFETVKLGRYMIPKNSIIGKTPKRSTNHKYGNNRIVKTKKVF